MMRTYKPYGIVNVFNVVPAFVFIVLERDGEFYFPFSDKHFKIEYFHKVPPSVIKNMKIFDEFNCNQIPIKEITLNSDFLFAFQINEKNIQIGTFSELVAFFSTYKTSDKVLKEKINNFIKEIRNQV